MTDKEHARSFAVEAHRGQLYGERPYAFHLDAVADIVIPYGEKAQVVAYLHDVVEDTEVSLDEIRARFGNLVAECVEMVTDAPGATRRERKAITHDKLAKVVVGPVETALLVKVADRLANVQACHADRDERRWEMYRNEHEAFRAAVWREGLCEELWQRLEILLAAWREPATD